ncbi:MAG: VWA domain-containing protein, partial [Thiomargarita sp.]|nr:VWA domain-containing protein [Thiomargarita sp.]
MLIRILIMITLMLPTSLVFGQAEFNIVLVIDESGSMWGSRHHPEANDQYRHRVSIVENVLVRLAEQVKGTSLVHRISVVEFGGDAAVSVNVPISNFELKYDPAKPNDIISNAKSIIARTLYARKRNMGNTNTALAIQTALTEFKKIEASRV